MISGFNIDIYDVSVTYAWNTSKEEIINFFSKNCIKDEYKSRIIEGFKEKNIGGFMCVVSDEDFLCVFFEPDNPKVIVHELFHVCHKIMTERNIEDEEAWAYLMGYLVHMYYEIKNKNHTDDR